MIRALALALALGPVAALAEDVPEPAGYRGEPYRAPVPDTLEGAQVVTTTEAYTLWLAGDAAFVDVMPRAPKPQGLPQGTIWRDTPRPSIPGAVWLPNTGYEALADETHAYFTTGLEAASDGNPGHPLVFFCLDDCWMSWNAAKRAIEAGYSDVIWFPEGTDGWAFYDYPVENADPAVFD